MIHALVYLVALGVVIGLILDSIVVIPKVFFGVRERFGRRTGRPLFEGIHLKFPLIERVSIYSTELVEKEVRTSFTTKDKLGLVNQGTLQYRANPWVVDEDGRNVFVGISNRVIEKGIAEAVESLLGALGGVNDHKSFIEKRLVLEDIINCMLRMATPPHMSHNTPGNPCQVGGCKFMNLPIIPTERLITFYATHRNVVHPLIQRNIQNQAGGVRTHKEPQDSSEIERRYGITIVYFALPKVDFTEETKKALEEKKQAEFRKAAGETRIDLADEIKQRLGVEGRIALDEADLILDAEVSKGITSVQGEIGVLGAFLGKNQKKE